MRRLLPCLCLVLLFGGIAVAQDREYPKWDFTGAFTYNDLQTPAPRTRQGLYGFTGAPAWNFRKNWALEGDVTYTWKNLNGIKRSLLSFIAGPRYTYRSSSIGQPFAHALVGGGHLSGFGNATNGWVGKFGGGLDLLAGKHVAIRAFQVDYYRYHGHLNTGKQRLDNVALTVGIRVF